MTFVSFTLPKKGSYTCSHSENVGGASKIVVEAKAKMLAARAKMLAVRAKLLAEKKWRKKFPYKLFLFQSLILS